MSTAALTTQEESWQEMYLLDFVVALVEVIKKIT